MSPQEAKARQDLLNTAVNELKNELGKGEGQDLNKVQELEKVIASNTDILNADFRFDVHQAKQKNYQPLFGKLIDTLA